jgi:hypothetical protein
LLSFPQEATTQAVSQVQRLPDRRRKDSCPIEQHHFFVIRNATSP